MGRETQERPTWVESKIGDTRVSFWYNSIHRAYCISANSPFEPLTNGNFEVLFREFRNTLSEPSQFIQLAAFKLAAEKAMKGFRAMKREQHIAKRHIRKERRIPFFTYEAIVTYTVKVRAPDTGQGLRRAIEKIRANPTKPSSSDITEINHK